jgi:hypothetical protein
VFLQFSRTGVYAGFVVVTEPKHRSCTAASADKQQDEPAVKYNKEFGYSRKDVVLIGAGLVALGYALYYGFQAAGVDPLMAGNFTQLIIILGLCIVWVGSYVFRVMNKVCPLRQKRCPRPCARYSQESLADRSTGRFMESASKYKYANIFGASIAASHTAGRFSNHNRLRGVFHL